MFLSCLITHATTSDDKTEVIVELINQLLYQVMITSNENGENRDIKKLLRKLAMIISGLHESRYMEESQRASC